LKKNSVQWMIPNCATTIRYEQPESAAPEWSPSLKASIRDGVSYAVMLGSGETYFGPFGIFLRASTLQVGLLASLPQLFGAVLQWAGAINMDRIKSRRRFVIIGALIQAVTLIPMALIPLLFGQGSLSVLILLTLAMVYNGANAAGLPVWSSLIGDLVPTEIRGRFFGQRNRLTTMSTLVSLLVAGLILHLFAQNGLPQWGFLVILVVALIARLNSVRWLIRYDDPSFTIALDQVFTFRQFLRRSPHSNFAKFVFFIGAINFSVAFSSPYFTLFMLRDLQFSYVEFTLVTGVVTLTQFLTFRHWGTLSDSFGNKKILNVCGWGVALVPVLWLVSHQIPYLLLIQIFSGLVWSGFNLACGNFLFDAVSPPKRARCVAYQGLVNGLFIFFGSLTGGFVAGHLPPSLSIGPWTWTPDFMLPVVFLLSGVMRAIAAGIFLKRFKEVRPVEPIRHRDLIYRISQIRPVAGATFSLITGLFREQPKRQKRNPKDKP
jgi:MFS family permease